MLEAITFDFWGTLYQNTYARDDRLRLMERFLERHGQTRSRPELDAAYSRARSVWDRVWRDERRSIPIDRWVDEMLRHLEIDLPAPAAAELGASIEEIYLTGDAPQPVPGATEVVPRLAEKYPLGLISDTGLTPGRVLRQVMERDGLRASFDVLTFSDELGTAKPSPQPFLHTLDGLGAQPERAVHIGDLPETDLSGARRVGMKAVLFLGVSHREDGREQADAVFEDYAELESLLEDLT